MGDMSFSKERFEELMKLLDKDGDGSVDKEEYEAVYRKMFPNTTEEEFEAVWKKIDDDGNGSLSMQELAAYYGFNLDAETSAEMTDEQILEALQMQAALIEMNAEKEAALRKEREAKREAEELEAKEKGHKTKDATIKMVDLEGKTRTGKVPTPDEKEKDLISFLEACQLGDLNSSDPENPTVLKFLEGGINVRIECDKGEMPLHKLARVQLTDRNQKDYTTAFEKLIELTRAQAKEAGRPGIQMDINHQDKNGKTPLYLAIEHKNGKMMDLLYGLGADGPDTLLVNSAGWTVLHSAVNTDDLDTLKKLISHFSAGRIKVLLQTQDRTGREPLHIAAYKCTEKMVQYLVSLGASNAKSDTNGNTASKLADRAGRRKSKEIIEGLPAAETPTPTPA